MEEHSDCEKNESDQPYDILRTYAKPIQCCKKKKGTYSKATVIQRLRLMDIS